MRLHLKLDKNPETFIHLLRKLYRSDAEDQFQSSKERDQQPFNLSAMTSKRISPEYDPLAGTQFASSDYTTREDVANPLQYLKTDVYDALELHFHTVEIPKIKTRLNQEFPNNIWEGYIPIEGVAHFLGNVFYQDFKADYKIDHQLRQHHNESE